MKLTDDKCHLIVSGVSNVRAKLGQELILAENVVTLLGVITDTILDFFKSQGYC